MWVCGFYRPNFDLSGRIPADRSYFREIYPYNSFPLKMLQVTRLIFLYMLIFVNFRKMPYFQVYSILARSSSRGVLTTKTLFGSKSIKSGLSNPVSNVPVALFNAEISYLELQKVLAPSHSELWRAFSHSANFVQILFSTWQGIHISKK